MKKMDSEKQPEKKPERKDVTIVVDKPMEVIVKTGGQDGLHG